MSDVVVKKITILDNGDVIFWESKEIRDIVEKIGDIEKRSKNIFGDEYFCG